MRFHLRRTESWVNKRDNRFNRDLGGDCQFRFESVRVMVESEGKWLREIDHEIHQWARRMRLNSNLTIDQGQSGLALASLHSALLEGLLRTSTCRSGLSQIKFHL